MAVLGVLALLDSQHLKSFIVKTSLLADGPSNAAKPRPVLRWQTQLEGLLPEHIDMNAISRQAGGCDALALEHADVDAAATQAVSQTHSTDSRPDNSNSHSPALLLSKSPDRCARPVDLESRTVWYVSRTNPVTMTNMNARKRQNTQTSPPHARISPARVDELLEIAAQVFAERGFDGASVNEMAKRANASKGTFYSRYPTKEALLMAVMGQRVQGLEADLAGSMAPHIEIEQALTSFADHMLSVVLSEPMLANYRVVTLEARRFPELGKAYYENGAGKMARFLASYLALKASEGIIELEHPQICAELFIDSIVGMPRLRAALGIGVLSRKERALRIELAVKTFLRGCQRMG